MNQVIREKMERYTFRIQKSLLVELKEKSGHIPVGRVIRLLIEKFVRGEVSLD